VTDEGCFLFPKIDGDPLVFHISIYMHVLKKSKLMAGKKEVYNV
jgi:hypothetical protein